MYIVTPLISESEGGRGQSAEAVYRQISDHDFKNYRVGLLHGKMRGNEKEVAMKKFIEKEYDILVSTTVIEVGVDVPNATIMLIEGAERFGLAQIHQLRGRVGRSIYASYCFLMLSSSQAPSTRLRALETISDGFQLAEIDLKLRGPGAIYGTLQHGALDLRVASLDNMKLISTARQAAQEFMDKKESIKKYPHLDRRINRLRAITNLN
jgi:ATP-dependent DNA helicase RecG